MWGCYDTSARAIAVSSFLFCISDSSRVGKLEILLQKLMDDRDASTHVECRIWKAAHLYIYIKGKTRLCGFVAYG